MANFRKRGPQQWQAQIRKKGYPAQVKTFSTRSAAERWAREVEHQMDQGAFISRSAAESTTLGELLTRYLEEITPTKRGAESETARLRALRRDPLAQRMVASIRGVDIARYRDERLHKVAPATVKRDLVIVSHLFEVARKEWGLPVANPVRDIKSPAHSKARERRLEAGWGGQEDEEGRLLKACREARNGYLLPLVQLALETAMRQGELVSLRWEHIDLGRRIAHLPDTKSGEARTVPLSTTAIETLRSLPRHLNGQVFSGLTTQAVKLAFARAVHRAGLTDLHFHDLRHEATSRLFERGLNLMEVASITGHQDLRMLRRYTHLRAEDLAKKLGSEKAIARYPG
jgi:integrase